MRSMQLIADRDQDGRVVLKSPGVGRWLRAPREGQIAIGGQSLGTLEILGREHTLMVPGGVRGVIVERSAAVQGTLDFAYGQVLVILGSELAAESNVALAQAQERSGGGLVFCSSSSGRFYLRPAPDKPPFVSEGEEIVVGQTVFLLEVMKTFSRVAYGGEGMPERARVLRILPKDGDDLAAEEVVLELEAVQPT